MTLALIPQPQRVTPLPGRFQIPPRGWIAFEHASLAAAAHQAARLMPGHGVSAIAPGQPHTLGLAFDPTIRPEGYRLTIRAGGMTLRCRDTAGAQYGVATLRQLLAQAEGGTLDALRIDDWPAFAVRGVYYDVTRGRVPHTARLLEQADLLATFKINHLQHYVEHTFRFRAHPLIGRGASPLTPEDVLQLDDRCHSHHIELVPSLACFGHMSTVLHHKPYRHLAEDWGEGRYLDPEADKLLDWQKRKAWSVAPANPATYRFLDSLLAEFAPLFRSPQFNVCCDETFDLGLGQSFALSQKRGKGRLYLEHLLHLRRLARRYGKRIMFWGDIIHHYPELIPEIPRDVSVLDWGYDHRTRFDRVAAFQKAGVPFLVCPGTSSWVSLFPRLPEAMASIAGYAQAARRHGARGLLNTDWGDRGHFNFMEFSWHGYAFGAEQAWNPRADASTFSSRFARVFIGSPDPAMARAVDALGEVAHLATDAHYQGIWYHVFFASPESPLFAGPRFKGFLARRGQIQPTAFKLDVELGRRTLAQLDDVRRVFAHGAHQRGVDPYGILPYWIFAVDTIAHAARRLTVLSPGGTRTARARRQLRDEMESLRARFVRLWLARNRRSEIDITLRAYRAAMRGL